MSLKELIEKFWPRVREAYLSPLSNASDEITGWQIEVMLTGGKTLAWQATTFAAAITQAANELCQDQR